MKEQEYEIKNIKSFELADIFDCGQCFRWNKQKMEVTQEYSKVM